MVPRGSISNPTSQLQETRILAHSGELHRTTIHSRDVAIPALPRFWS
ncbi:hypothetical protein MNBD_ALPHA11-1913 [hydrothermal vent metagenome]|uniref:Uncharacterized protein n=1 Tax=hydrothermal vent metagenome TaxID=652676 RepID=A0A3B0TN25_9ZZZZ